MQHVGIKICGIRTEAALDEAVRLGCSSIGLIFFPVSPRNVEIAAAAALVARAKGRIKTVAVTVDADDDLLARITNEVKPDYLQLHGSETPQRAGEIRARGIRVIKAFAVRESDDVARANTYAQSADMLLFDAKAPKHGLPGGNGVSFDWRLLSNRTLPLPWFLSGGLNAENVSQAIRLSGARIVDVSSSVERAPGEKDTNLMQEFVQAVRQTEPVL